MNRGVRDAGYFGFVICTSSLVGSDCTRGVRACAELRGGRSGRVASLCESDRDGDIPPCGGGGAAAGTMHATLTLWALELEAL